MNASKLGAVLVAADTRLSADEIGYLLGHSQAKVVVVDGGLLDVVSGATTTGAKAPDVTDVVLVDSAGADAVGSAQDRERVGDRLVDLAHFRQRTGDCVLEPTWDMADEEQHICLNYTSRHSLTPPYS